MSSPSASGLSPSSASVFVAQPTAGDKHHPQWHLPYGQNPPTHLIAGVTVIDTPVVRAAQSLARQHTSDFVYNHVMRSWLYGVLIISHNTTLQASVGLEVHAIAALLHDLGWDRSDDSPHVSHDKRFEIDGALAAREFLNSFSRDNDGEE